MEEVIQQAFGRLEPHDLGIIIAFVLGVGMTAFLFKWKEVADFILILLKRKEPKNGYVTIGMFELMCKQNEKDHQELKEYFQERLDRIEKAGEKLSEKFGEATNDISSIKGELHSVLEMVMKLGNKD